MLKIKVLKKHLSMNNLEWSKNTQFYLVLYDSEKQTNLRRRGLS